MNRYQWFVSVVIDVRTRLERLKETGCQTKYLYRLMAVVDNADHPLSVREKVLGKLVYNTELFEAAFLNREAA